MREKLTNEWFFSNPHPLLKLLLIFVKGDMVLLLPFSILIAATYLLSLKTGILVTGVYMFVRFIGEMFYWIMQQFGDRKYRPNDFGFTNLDNNAIYILYQTFAIISAIVGVVLMLFGLHYVK